MLLAKNGHKITGVDIDEYMLERLYKKLIGLNNVNILKADTLKDNWGENFDLIILACNIMMNIETLDDYEKAQKTFIKNSSNALKKGGYLYLDFTLYNDPEKVFGTVEKEWTIFEGLDDNGITGKFIMCKGGMYNKNTQMCTGKRRIELNQQNGKQHVYEFIVKKRIPTLIEIEKWLQENDFNIEQKYGNYNMEPISGKTNKAIIYAKKVVSIQPHRT